ncbi:MAG: enoyl-CoA hydratase [Pseudomonadota bacterium]
MPGSDAGIRLFSAAFSVLVSAAFFAYAIIPASPGLVA